MAASGVAAGRLVLRATLLTSLLLPILALLPAPMALAEPARILGTGRTIDGDTLDIGVVRIRLHGIDAPERDQRCPRAEGGDWNCGLAATHRLAELADGRPLDCAALDRDRYGRIVGICRADGVDLNALLIREGLAWAYTRYADDYADAEAAARAAGIGIWQAEAVPPWDYRAGRWERAAAAAPRPGCPIKGNISADGTRIYHTPWSPWYDRVRIDEAQGERWFCDEAEAEAAGWRAPR